MLRNYYINRAWIVSVTARRIYRVSAWLSLLLLPAAIAFVSAPATFAPVLRLVIFGGVIGTATTWVAMEYFLFGFDQSGSLFKLFWFLVMLVPFIGPAIYCLTYYSRQTAPAPERSQSAASMSA